MVASPVYFNLETQRNAMDTEGWHPERMGVSVAVALTDTRLHIFTDENIHELMPLLESAGTVIGYNIEQFDFKVLSGYPGISLDGVRHVDLMKELQKDCHVRVMLDAATAATLGVDQEGDGLEMVKLWKDGKLLPIVEHCTGTTLLIKALHEYGRQHGHVFHHREGSTEKVQIDVDW